MSKNNENEEQLEYSYQEYLDQGHDDDRQKKPEKPEKMEDKGEARILTAQKHQDIQCISPANEKEKQEIIEAIKREFQVRDEIVKIAMKFTKPTDWVIMGKRDINNPAKAYLCASGCANIGNKAGVCTQVYKNRVKITKGNTTIEREEAYEVRELKNEHYIIIFHGKFWRYANPDFFVEEVGSRRSNDPFFTKKGGVTLAASQINFGDVLRAAKTNWYNRGIKNLLGLPVFDESELSNINIGGKQEQIPRVSFKSKKADRGDYSHAPKNQDTKKVSEGFKHIEGCITEPQMRRLFYILSKGATSQEERKERYTKIKKIIKEVAGVEHTNEIIWQHYEDICNAAEQISNGEL
jgi:hypothetical protein